jgi:peptidoglycan glycosyltransferase
MQASIGQGTTQITPLHLNMITSAIANGGMLMKPYLVDYVENVDGAVVKQFNPDSYKRLMTTEEASALTEMMHEVVESGTGTKLSGLSYSAAGKTGSAEYSSVKTDSHAWFTGFAPVENPEICVTIIIEGAGSGGDYAVPIAKRIFDAYFGT